MRRSTDSERQQLDESFLSAVRSMPSGSVVVAYFPDVHMIFNKHDAHEHEAGRDYATNVADEKHETMNRGFVYRQSKEEDVDSAAEGYIKRMQRTHEEHGARRDHAKAVASEKAAAKRGQFLHHHSEKEDVNLAAGEYIKKKHYKLEMQI